MIIIINGYPESGKDTFIEMCDKLISDRPVISLVTSDPMKSALTVLGWDGIKTPEVRDLLSYLKAKSNLLFNTTERWVDEKLGYAMDLANCEKRPEPLVFIHVREIEEIEHFRKKYKALTLLIKRDTEASKLVSNRSDKEVNEYRYDAVIDNSGTLDHLKGKALAFVERIQTENLCPYCDKYKKFPHCTREGEVTVLGISKRGSDNVVRCEGYE